MGRKNGARTKTNNFISIQNINGQVDTGIQFSSSLPALLHVKQLGGETEGFLLYSRKNGKMIDTTAEGFSHGFHLSFTCKQR